MQKENLSGADEDGLFEDADSNVGGGGCWLLSVTASREGAAVAGRVIWAGGKPREGRLRRPLFEAMAVLPRKS